MLCIHTNQHESETLETLQLSSVRVGRDPPVRKTTPYVEESCSGWKLLGPVANTQLKHGTGTGQTHGTN